MESVKYFKYELDTLSRKALELINKKNTKTVYFGKSQYYYGTDGTCKKTSFGLMKDQIVSPKQIIEMFSEKKEPVKNEEIELEMTIKYKDGNIGNFVKFDAMIMINMLQQSNIESVIVQKKKDPLFEQYIEISRRTDIPLREKFNQVKHLFNK